MKAVSWFSDLLKKVGGLCLFGMVFLTCADVIGDMFGYPILGSEEIVGLMAAVLLAFALPATQREKSHIGVDLLYGFLSGKVRRILRRGISLVSSVFFLVVAWQCFLYGNETHATGQVSLTVKFPVHYTIYCVSFACLVLAAVIFSELFEKSPGDTHG